LGLIPGATPVALSGLDDWAASAPRDVPLIVHCQTGTRAIVGASLLRARGFTDVTPMTGGFEAWTAAGHPVVVPFST
jgi:hydroxyacylglutathione hydrolase